MLEEERTQTSNPAIIALRAHMKDELINHIAEAMSGRLWEGAEPIIYGSSTLQQLYTTGSYKVPLGKFKSEDVDFGIYDPNARTPQQHRAQMEEHYVPLMRDIVSEGNYQFSIDGWQSIDNMAVPLKVQADTPEAIRNLGADKFMREFMLNRTFSYGEALDIISQRSDGAQIMPYLERAKELFEPHDELNVPLAFGVNSGQVPVMLDPLKLPTKGSASILVADPLDSIAGKMRRLIAGNKKKPTDYIDLYNFTHGTNSEGQPIVDLNPDSPGNDLDTIRVLTVAMLPRHAGFNYDNQFLLHEFEKDTRREEFDSFVSQWCSELKLPSLMANAEEVIAEAENLVRNVFAPKGKDAQGKLNLTDRERHYVDGILGIEEQTSLKGWYLPPVKIGNIEITPRVGGHTHVDRELADPKIRTELLEAQFPEAFEAHPEMRRTISNNIDLVEMCDYVRERREGVGGTGNVHVDW